MNRRSFFNRIARAATIVALAPQIAFRAPRLKLGIEEEVGTVGFWSQTKRYSLCVDEDYRKFYECTMATAFVNVLSKEQLESASDEI